MNLLGFKVLLPLALVVLGAGLCAGGTILPAFAGEPDGTAASFSPAPIYAAWGNNYGEAPSGQSNHGSGGYGGGQRGTSSYGGNNSGGNGGGGDSGGNTSSGNSGGGNSGGGNSPAAKAVCIGQCRKQCMDDFVPGSNAQKSCSSRCARRCLVAN